MKSQQEYFCRITDKDIALTGCVTVQKVGVNHKSYEMLYHPQCVVCVKSGFQVQ